MNLQYIPRDLMGPLVAVAIGDTYGARFEYRKGDWARENTALGYGLHPTHADIRLGHYTDDTQMSIGMAEGLIDRELWDERLDAYFRKAYWRDPRPGYSRGMLGALKEAKASGRTLMEVCAEFGRSEKSGAAMRATPLGLLPKLAMVQRIATSQGYITHTGSAIEAAVAAAFAAHYMLYEVGKRANLLDWLAERLGNPIWRKPWVGAVGSPGMESTRAALTAVVQATSLRDLLIRSVAFTGDVDTVAAIAMGCAWTYDDLPHDLPYALWDGLENDTYGRDYMHSTDQALLSKYRPELLAA